MEYHNSATETMVGEKITRTPINKMGKRPENDKRPAVQTKTDGRIWERPISKVGLQGATEDARNNNNLESIPNFLLQVLNLLCLSYKSKIIYRYSVIVIHSKPVKNKIFITICL